MDFEARMIRFLGEITGTSKAGNPWKKKEWVVETFGQYPKKVKVTCFGDRADNIHMEEGNDYILSVDLESREYNDRWYTDVNVFRVQPFTANSNQPSQNYGGGYSQPSQPNYGGNYGQQNNGAAFGGGNQPYTPPADESDEDLPF